MSEEIDRKRPERESEKERKSKKANVRMIVEAGIMIALSQILSYLTIFHMPAGGSVTPGSMIPVIIFAIRWGPKNGVLAGVVYGILQFVLGTKYSFHPVSILCDYPLAFGMLGIAGIFGKKLLPVMAGITAGIFGRFVFHVISGVAVFASYAPEGQSPLVYSVIYNGTFLLPELAITLVVAAIIYPLVNRLKGADSL